MRGSQAAEALNAQVKETLEPPYQIAAQNSWARGVGAYTGEIAPELLVDLGIGWVILGHSERRSIIGESSELVRSSPTRAFSRAESKSERYIGWREGRSCFPCCSCSGRWITFTYLTLPTLSAMMCGCHTLFYVKGVFLCHSDDACHLLTASVFHAGWRSCALCVHAVGGCDSWCRSMLELRGAMHGRIAPMTGCDVPHGCGTHHCWLSAITTDA